MYNFIEIAEMQNAAGETRHICYFGPLSMNDKLSADRIEQATKFAKFTEPLYLSYLYTRFKLS